MKILVACEESQAVTIELRKLGHEAYSCDIEPCSGGHPEWHIMQDVLPLLDGFCTFKTVDGLLHNIGFQKWDMIIAFPPCTYMSNAGACRMYPTKGNLDLKRLEKGNEAKKFFMKFYDANCEKIAIENPRPLKIIGLPMETQRIQPFMFGNPYTKMTYLWLKQLEKLEPTDLITENIKPFVNAGSFSANGERRKKTGFTFSATERSKTFPGIAKAMAEQWAGSIEVQE